MQDLRDIVYACEKDPVESEFNDTPELQPGRTLIPSNGVFSYRINNFTPDASRYVIEEVIDEALDFWESQIGYPFVYVNHEDPVHIEFNFAVNGDPDLPQAFRENVLAFAYAPSRQGRSTVWINDERDWSEGGSDGLDRLYKVIVHELGHSLNLRHSEDPNCVTFFSIGNNEVQLTGPSLNTIEKLYPFN